MKIKQIDNLQQTLDTKLNTSQLSTDPALGTNNTLISSQAAVKTYIDNNISTISSLYPMQFKGYLDASLGLFPQNIIIGDLYVISADGIINTLVLNTNDIIFANKTKVGVTNFQDWVKIDNTEAADIIRTSNIINDNTFQTASITTLPTSLSVKNYIDTNITLVNNNITNSIAQENVEDFFPLYTVSANSIYTIVLAHLIKSNSVVTISICGIVLAENEYNFQYNTDTIYITVNYQLDTTDKIRIAYKY